MTSGDGAAEAFTSMCLRIACGGDEQVEVYTNVVSNLCELH
jgi:hypothetical protein